MFLDYIFNKLLPEMEEVVLGSSHAPKRTELKGVKPPGIDTGNVAEELKTFGKECKHVYSSFQPLSIQRCKTALPKFLVDQMERDTTRYVNLTTIATFFSSVTATTLQFTYAPLQSEASESLRAVVNLFWFLSLVFSVSSGVSSLLGLTWRKSSMCVIYSIYH